MSRYINVKKLDSELNAIWCRLYERKLENPLKNVYDNKRPSMCKDIIYQVFLLGDYNEIVDLQNSVIYEYCFELAMSGFVEIENKPTRGLSDNGEEY